MGWGIEFRKPRIFAAGGGPAYYVRGDHFDGQQWDADLYSFVTPFWPTHRQAHLKDAKYLNGNFMYYAHERERRVRHEFAFDHAYVEFVILDTYEGMARLPKELQDAIGRNKVVLMDMYKLVEDLWRTHLVGGDG